MKYQIYMLLDNGRMVEMEKVEDFFTGMDRVRLYFNRNPHIYYLRDLTTNEMIQAHELLD